MNRTRTFLLILDGYGLRELKSGNAVKLANTPCLHRILGDRPQATLSASGLDVGLPAGLMGNSEVGHLNLGAGRIVYQEISHIDREIENLSFFDNPALTASARHALHNGSKWHLIGLVSDGGVHSSMNHIYALLELARREGLQRVFLHALTDGRDTPPHAGVNYIRQVEEKMASIGVGQIASVCGRYWAMDRDQRWPRIEKAYRLLTAGTGLQFSDAPAAVADSYRREVTDEFLEPSAVVRNGKPLAMIENGDAVLFFNFRSDRARQMTDALTAADFPHFERPKLALHFTMMTQYRADLDLPAAFPPRKLANIFAAVLAAAAKRQFRVAETEKYAHVTFFFNGGVETPYPGEERELIPSPKVATYDLQPEMSAAGVADRALQALDGNYDFILLNFANPDMVGHTGVLNAAISALETLDPLVESLLKKAQAQGFATLITADHGNCEYMIDEENGGPHTAHTTNRVPVALFLPDGSQPKLRQDGILGDVAPTLLQLLNLNQPPEMQGRSLIIP